LAVTDEEIVDALRQNKFSELSERMTRDELLKFSTRPRTLDEILAMAEGITGKPPDGLKAPDEYEHALYAVGRVYGPDLLVWWDQRSLLDTNLLSKLLCGVWSLAELPEKIGRPRWIRWFRKTGFLSNCGASQPTKPLRVYRGCTHRQVRHMAWSDDLRIAQFFANYRFERYGRSGPKSFVYTALIEPRGVLAIIEERKGEREVIVDPRFLRDIKRIP